MSEFPKEGANIIDNYSTRFKDARIKVHPQWLTAGGLALRIAGAMCLLNDSTKEFGYILTATGCASDLADGFVSRYNYIPTINGATNDQGADKYGYLAETAVLTEFAISNNDFITPAVFLIMNGLNLDTYLKRGSPLEQIKGFIKDTLKPMEQELDLDGCDNKSTKLGKYKTVMQDLGNIGFSAYIGGVFANYQEITYEAVRNGVIGASIIAIGLASTNILKKAIKKRKLEDSLTQ